MKPTLSKTPHIALLTLAAIGLAACSPGVENLSDDPQQGVIDATTYAKVSVAATSSGGTNQTQVERSDFRSVVVNVNRIELIASRGEHEGRIIIAEDVGPVDLMTLNTIGIPLALGNANLIADTTIHQIRLVLHDDGHMVRLSSGDVCSPKTPGQQQSGLKIILPGGLRLSGQSTYTFTTEFDPYHSIVLQPHGRCLLKPVIKSRCSVHRGHAMEKGKKNHNHSHLCTVIEAPSNPNEEPENPADNEDPTDGDSSDSGDNGDGSNSDSGSSDDGDTTSPDDNGGADLPADDGTGSSDEGDAEEPPIFNPDDWNILF